MKFSKVLIAGALLACTAVAHATAPSLTTTFFNVVTSTTDAFSFGIDATSTGSIHDVSLIDDHGASVDVQWDAYNASFFVYDGVTAGATYTFKLTSEGITGITYGATAFTAGGNVPLAVTAAVPEPGSMALAAAGLAVAGLMARRRRTV